MIVAAHDGEHDAEEGEAGKRRTDRIEAAFGRRLSLSRVRTSGTSATPMGTLTQKIQFQEMCSVMVPPTSGPLAMARPLVAPQMPSA